MGAGDTGLAVGTGQGHDFLLQEAAVGQGFGPHEDVEVQQDGEVGEQVPAGDGAVAVGCIAGGVTAGDEQGEEGHVEFGIAKEVDEGAAGAAGIDCHGNSARGEWQSGGPGLADAIEAIGNDDRIGSIAGAERVAGEAADVESGPIDMGEGVRIPALVGPKDLQGGEGRVVLSLAQIEAELPGGRGVMDRMHVASPNRE